MIKIAKHIVLLISAIAVFYIGAGVTIVSYCCGACDHGIYASVEEMDCCKHHAENEGVHCDTHEAHFDHQCVKAKVVTFDLENSTFKPQSEISMMWIAHSFMDACQTCAEYISKEEQSIFSKAPPITPARAYLSEIRVLII